MLTINELLHEVERLPAADKWRLVRHVLHSLEEQQREKPEPSDWHEFLLETYGSLRDTPIKRWDQVEYEERE